MVAQSYPTVVAVESPTERLAVVYMAALAAGAGVEAGDPFDLFYLDSLLGQVFEPAALFEIIRTFGLEPVG
jgi:hypothetical protein